MFTWQEFNDYIKIKADEAGVILNRDQRKLEYQRYKREIEMELTPAHTHNYCNPPETYSLACMPTAMPVSDIHQYRFNCNKEEGINPMNYASASVTTAPTEAQQQRKYLENRLDIVYREKRDPLEALFGLTDDDAPRDPKEFAERIKDGKFVIRGLGDDAFDYRYYSWYDLIQWRDPAKKADKEGFDKARTELKKKRQEALDIIKIDEPKAGLDAVKALEALEFTGPAN